jgi:hypothetical protein
MGRFADLPTVRLLDVGLSSIAAVSPLAFTALRARFQVTVSYAGTGERGADGTGYTPNLHVTVQPDAGGSVAASGSVSASAPTWICYEGLKPVCHDVGDGTFSAGLPVDDCRVCNETAGAAHRASAGLIRVGKRA